MRLRSGFTHGVARIVFRRLRRLLVQLGSDAHLLCLVQPTVVHWAFPHVITCYHLFPLVFCFCSLRPSLTIVIPPFRKSCLPPQREASFLSDDRRTANYAGYR